MKRLKKYGLKLLLLKEEIKKLEKEMPSSSSYSNKENIKKEIVTLKSKYSIIKQDTASISGKKNWGAQGEESTCITWGTQMPVSG